MPLVPAMVDNVTAQTSGLPDPTAGGGAGIAVLDDHIYQRLLRERIIFLGSEVRDQNANAICAQLLLLSAEDPSPTSSSTSTAPEALSTPAWRSTTR